VRLATNQPTSVLRAQPQVQPYVSMFGYGSLLALGAIDPDALPALLDILTNAITPGTRIGAVGAIRGVGTKARPAVPVLLRYVNDENDQVAAAVVGALGATGPGDLRALVALEEVAQGPRLALRSTALDALSHFGDLAVPALVRALCDTNRGNETMAFYMLVYAAPSAITNTQVLAIAAEGLQSANAERRQWAAWVLGAIGQQASGTKPDLMHPISRRGLMLEDATNVLRHLAPELLDKGPPQ